MKYTSSLFLISVVSVICLVAVFGIIWMQQRSERLAQIEEQKITQAELEKLSTAVFAGGCFWCVEADFEKLEGVKEVVSGYGGGTTPEPTYPDHGDHLEVVQVYYDAAAVTYEELVAYFFRHVDPTDAGGQFVDRGHSYTTAIFYQTEAEQQTAERIAQELVAAGRFEKIVTLILPYTNFYKAEEYHQDYYKKNPTKYGFYRSRSGRDQFLEEVWGATEK